MPEIAKPPSVWVVGGLVFAVLETAMIWWRIPYVPLFWICLLWVVVTIILFRRASTARGRVLWINIAAIIGAIGLCEGLLWLGQQRNPYAIQSGTVLGGTFAQPGHFVIMPSPGLGYRPRPGLSATSTRTVDGRLAYAVRYSVDADGLRVAPPPGPEASRVCVLMFGDSMAWGEGVNDSETTSYQLATLSGGRVAARNFAFTGYSAHQMLWRVQSGEVAAKARCDPRQPVLAIYQTLPNNVSRVAGLRGWDDYGPRYRLIGATQLSYAGGFDAGESILDDHVMVPAPVAAALSRSVVYNRVFGRDRPPNGFDLDRFCAVVSASADGLKRLYPRLSFLVIVWPDFNDPADARAVKVAAMLRGLRDRKLRAVTIDAFQPGFDAAPLPYLIAGDGHPNPLMHRRLAEALLAHEPMLAAAMSGQHNPPQQQRKYQ